MNSNNIDRVRKSSLDSIDKAERRFRLVVFFAVLVEAGMLGTYLVVMNFADRLHWLVLIAAVLVYSTVAVGLAA